MEVLNMDNEFLFREILNRIVGLGCYFDYHQLHSFIVGERGNEFRLSGKFGNGFKLYRRNFDGQFSFGQYREDETEESVKWIEKENKYLKILQSVA
jgi:hypothetical protein